MKKERQPEPQRNSDSTANSSQVSPTCPKPIVSRRLSDKYLQECRDRVLAADPIKSDLVINDLRRRIYRLTNHIQKLQNDG